MCHTTVGENRKYRHWIEEFTARDPPPGAQVVIGPGGDDGSLLSFPLERLLPQIVTAWDLQILVVSQGRLPCGLVCSPACLAFLDNHGFPHRLRRLSLCRRRGCTNINLRPPPSSSSSSSPEESVAAAAAGLPNGNTNSRVVLPPPGLPQVPLPRESVGAAVAKVGSAKENGDVSPPVAEKDEEAGDGVDIERLRKSLKENGTELIPTAAPHQPCPSQASGANNSIGNRDPSVRAMEDTVKDVRKSVSGASTDLEEAARVIGMPLSRPISTTTAEPPPPQARRQAHHPASVPPVRKYSVYPWDGMFSATCCRFGCGGGSGSGSGSGGGLAGVGEDFRCDLPFTPSRLLAVGEATGSLRHCGHCGERKTMATSCPECAAVHYCDMPCQVRDARSHDCHSLRLRSSNRLLHFGGRPFEGGGWAMVGTSLDLFYAVKNFHRCRACFPYVAQVVLNKGPTARKQYMANWFPSVVRSVFGMHRLSSSSSPSASDPSAPFSLLHLGSLLDILERMVADSKNPELMANCNVENCLDALLEVYSAWMRDWAGEEEEEGGGGGGGGGSSNFYDYTSVMDLDAALKYCHVYACSLCAHAAMAQVEDEDLDAQRERASSLERLLPMFMRLVSCGQTSPLVSTYQRTPEMLTDDPLISIR